MTRPSWVAPHGMTSVTELDKAVVLGSDWLVFCDYGFSVCPLMPSRNTYRLTWVSLTLDEGYLLPAAPPDLERGVAPLSTPVPAQPLLGGGVAPLGCRS